MCVYALSVLYSLSVHFFRCNSFQGTLFKCTLAIQNNFSLSQPLHCICSSLIYFPSLFINNRHFLVSLLFTLFSLFLTDGLYCVRLRYRMFFLSIRVTSVFCGICFLFVGIMYGFSYPSQLQFCSSLKEYCMNLVHVLYRII